MKTVLHIDGKPVTLENVARKAVELSFTLGKKSYSFRSARLSDGSFLLEREVAPGVWKRSNGSAAQGKDFKRVQLGALEAKITESSSATQGSGPAAALSPLAPMPGLVRQILVKKGQRVREGQPIAVMEAMKLQMTLSAGGDGVVDAVLVQEGEMIAEGTELVQLSPLKEKAA